jgi:hypothetical protein
LSDADLSRADLSRADLSQCTGLLSAAEWMNKFEKDNNGVIVYKRIGKTQYPTPDTWEIKTGAVIEEVCNPCRTTECGCGVNFGMREWCEKHYTSATLWKCRISWIDLASVIVPYNTDGKARCERLKLLEIVE